jgi:hypothetical protein
MQECRASRGILYLRIEKGSERNALECPKRFSSLDSIRSYPPTRERTDV